jgi:hypothetical protein
VLSRDYAGRPKAHFSFVLSRCHGRGEGQLAWPYWGPWRVARSRLPLTIRPTFPRDRRCCPRRPGWRGRPVRGASTAHSSVCSQRYTRRAIGSAARVRQQNQHRRAHVALRYAGATCASYWFWSHNAGCHDDVGRLPAPLTKWSEQNETAYETCAHWRRSNKIYRAGSSQSRNQRAVCPVGRRARISKACVCYWRGRPIALSRAGLCLPKEVGQTTFAAPST